MSFVIVIEQSELGLIFLKTTLIDKLPIDLEGMEVSMERLLALIPYGISTKHF